MSKRKREPLRTFRSVVNGVALHEYRIEADLGIGNPQVEMSQVYTICSLRNEDWRDDEKYSSKYSWAYRMLVDIGYNFDTDRGVEFERELYEYEDKDAFDRAVKILEKHYHFAFLRRSDLILREHSGERFNPDGVCYAKWSHIKSERAWQKLSPQRRKRERDYMSGEIETFRQYLDGEVYYITQHKIDPVTGYADDEPLESCGGFYGWDNIEHHVKDGFCDGGDLTDITDRRVAFNSEVDAIYREIVDDKPVKQYVVWKKHRDLVSVHMMSVDPCTFVAKTRPDDHTVDDSMSGLEIIREYFTSADAKLVKMKL